MTQTPPPPYKEQLTGIILAGGQSRRMGANKGFLTVMGEPLIKRAVRLLEPHCAHVVIVTNYPQETHALTWGPHVSIVLDDEPFQGPLSGLASVLAHVKTEWMFVRAVDMPWLAPGLIGKLWEEKDGFEVVVPRSRQGDEPLCALYRVQSARRWVPVAVSRGKRSVMAYTDYAEVRTLEPHELAQVDRRGDSFLNINHPDQLEDVQHELGQHDLALPSEEMSAVSWAKIRDKRGKSLTDTIWAPRTRPSENG